MAKKQEIHYPTISHLGIQVADLEKSCEFYKNLLGLTKISIMEGSLGPMAFLKLGAFELVLHHIPGESVSKRNQLDHFGVEVADLSEPYEKAKAMNAVKSDIHKSFQWYQFNAVDPDGYPFHVMSLTPHPSLK